MQEGLKQILSKYSLENRVHFIGFISGEEKSEAYHAAEMLVIPSRLEAMSIVALEAGICGTPVVMTDQCGFSELVEAGGGLEVGVNDECLADVLLELMDDKHRLEVMGNKAQSFIRDNYTWEIAAKRHRQLCHEVCENLLT
jgi:glycosyltransferase involved in cell wall biosynthesis